MPNQASPPTPCPELFRALVEQGHHDIFRYRPGTPRGFDFLSPSITELTGYPVEAFMADPDMFRSRGALAPSELQLLRTIDISMGDIYARRSDVSKEEWVSRS